MLRKIPGAGSCHLEEESGNSISSVNVTLLQGTLVTLVLRKRVFMQAGPDVASIKEAELGSFTALIR